MKFKNSVKRGSGILKQGDRRLFRTVEARYMGSFKNDDDVHWNHMLLVQQTMDGGELYSIEEFIVTTTDVRDIVFKSMMEKPLEGQLVLC